MTGTYKITETLSQSPKFSCMVSFNGATAELYEVELPNDIGDGAGVDLPTFSAEFINSVLQKVADDALASTESQVQTTEDIKVSEGQIVL